MREDSLQTNNNNNMASATFPIPNSEKSRYEKLKTVFKLRFNQDPTHYTRAPGRVNLIGEHIDYCGYAVLPMAIEQDIVIAITTNTKHEINLTNTNDSFNPHSCSTKLSEITIDKNNPQWFHYFLCGYRGVLEHYGMQDSVGINIVVDGTVPKSAGLSSSSACVCSAALATMVTSGAKSCTKLELAEICQRCERYIGTEGGGMDQSISFLAEHGTAKLIEFNPIRATDIKLPPGAVFVISNSCVEMNKAATSHYNIRVAECRLAAQLLAKANGIDWRPIRRLCDVQLALSLTLDDAVQLVKDTLHQGAYNKQELCNILEVTEEELNTLSLNEKTLCLDAFYLRDRAQHVYSEAARVLQFKQMCDSAPPAALEKLGELMNASHASCRDQYECSCAELDQLTDLARRSGALGSRLTGAGWGGCAVSLVPSDRIQTFQQQMHDGYYANNTALSAQVKDSLFATQPGGGACIYVQG